MSNQDGHSQSGAYMNATDSGEVQFGNGADMASGQDHTVTQGQFDGQQGGADFDTPASSYLRPRGVMNTPPSTPSNTPPATPRPNRSGGNRGSGRRNRGRSTSRGRGGQRGFGRGRGRGNRGGPQNRNVQDASFNLRHNLFDGNTPYGRPTLDQNALVNDIVMGIATVMSGNTPLPGGNTNNTASAGTTNGTQQNNNAQPVNGSHSTPMTGVNPPVFKVPGSAAIPSGNSGSATAVATPSVQSGQSAQTAGVPNSSGQSSTSTSQVTQCHTSSVVSVPTVQALHVRDGQTLPVTYGAPSDSSDGFPRTPRKNPAYTGPPVASTGVSLSHKTEYYTDSDGRRMAVPVSNPAYVPPPTYSYVMSGNNANTSTAPTPQTTQNNTITHSLAQSYTGARDASASNGQKDWASILKSNTASMPSLSFLRIPIWDDNKIKEEHLADDWAVWFQQFIHACASHGMEPDIAAAQLCGRVNGRRGQSIVSSIDPALRSDFNYVANELYLTFCPPGTEMSANCRFETFAYTGETSYTVFVQDLKKIYAQFDTGHDPIRREVDLKRRFLTAIAHTPEGPLMGAQPSSTSLMALVASADNSRQLRLCADQTNPASQRKVAIATTPQKMAPAIAPQPFAATASTQVEMNPEDAAVYNAIVNSRRPRSRSNSKERPKTVCSLCFKPNHDYDTCFRNKDRKKSPYPRYDNYSGSGRSQSKSPRRSDSSSRGRDRSRSRDRSDKENRRHSSKSPGRSQQGRNSRDSSRRRSSSENRGRSRSRDSKRVEFSKPMFSMQDLLTAMQAQPSVPNNTWQQPNYMAMQMPYQQQMVPQVAQPLPMQVQPQAVTMQPASITQPTQPSN